MDDHRQYPQHPVLAVGGVVVREARVLLVRRGHPPMEGSWSIPGGMLELGEALAQAIRRELLEETGVDAHPLELIEIYEKAICDDAGRPQYHFVILDYLCEYRGGEVHAGSDVTDAAWIAEGELENLHLSSAALRVVKKAFAMSARRQSC